MELTLIVRVGVIKDDFSGLWTKLDGPLFLIFSTFISHHSHIIFFSLPLATWYNHSYFYFVVYIYKYLQPKHYKNLNFFLFGSKNWFIPFLFLFDPHRLSNVSVPTISYNNADKLVHKSQISSPICQALIFFSFHSQG